jgi:hypothetical protein
VDGKFRPTFAQMEVAPGGSAPAAVASSSPPLTIGDPVAEDQALADCAHAVDRIHTAVKHVSHFNTESGRLIPTLSVSLAQHAKMLVTLRTSVGQLHDRAARCRQRVLAMAERNGVDVAALHLHDPDAEVLEGN